MCERGTEGIRLTGSRSGSSYEGLCAPSPNLHIIFENTRKQWKEMTRCVSSKLILVVVGTLQCRGHGESQEKAASDFTTEVMAACIRGAGGDGETWRDPGGILARGLAPGHMEERRGPRPALVVTKLTQKLLFPPCKGEQSTCTFSLPARWLGCSYHPVITRNLFLPRAVVAPASHCVMCQSFGI